MAKKVKSESEPRWSRAKEPEQLSHKVIRWHKLLAEVTGGLSLRMVKKSITKRECLEWSQQVITVAEEMRKFAHDR